MIVFESTHYAIAAEKLFKEKGFKFDIIPTPREITHSCGLSIKFVGHPMEEYKRLMEESNIIIKGIYEIKKISNEKVVSQVG